MRIYVWLALIVGLVVGVLLPGFLVRYERRSPTSARPSLPMTDRQMPRFMWPPPPASAETRIPRNWLATEGGAASLADVAGLLEGAVRVAHYRRWSYLWVPEGFALVTQMEQIKSDGTPSPEPARWSTELPSVGELGLVEFIKALISAPEGRYRVIVFVVTDQPWSRTGERPTGEEAELWLKEGLNRLPTSIGQIPYGEKFETAALVYEFIKRSQSEYATVVNDSDTGAEDHLKRAGILEPLTLRMSYGR